ncbi:helix-turn-helix domain-containing protein [Halococcus saccharolyticus]|uniref:DNA binding domain-containing protein n=1 Tax=Halococcus saccharolyticus DSM 5350 TaxID=1227455 RepID=M0MEA6_9EURY|nr:helix-turn-helix domain-containing protein [Halococcus saccharolyticus]EMA42750.1 DNA binding domain-containing protein [Halococcus saccharolyticus DSM 5350]
MSTIANIEIPADEFALHDTLVAVSDLELDVERVVAHDDERVMPFIWVSSDHMDDVERAFENDASIENLELLSDLGEERLYRMDWTTEIEVVVQILVEADATVLDAFGTDGRWEFRILFPEREALSMTHEFCEENGLTIDIQNIYEMDADRHGRFGLSEAQHETLIAAFEHGHYEVPRDITLDDLADELDISHQALSERFRRAYSTLIENTLIVGVGDEE